MYTSLAQSSSIVTSISHWQGTLVELITTWHFSPALFSQSVYSTTVSLTSLLKYKRPMPMARKAMPMTKKVGNTVPGVRIGCQAGNCCWLNGVSVRNKNIDKTFYEVTKTRFTLRFFGFCRFWVLICCRHYVWFTSLLLINSLSLVHSSMIHVSCELSW